MKNLTSRSIWIQGVVLGVAGAVAIAFAAARLTWHVPKSPRNEDPILVEAEQRIRKTFDDLRAEIANGLIGGMRIELTDADIAPFADNSARHVSKLLGDNCLRLGNSSEYRAACLRDMKPVLKSIMEDDYFGVSKLAISKSGLPIGTQEKLFKEFEKEAR